MEEYSPMTLSPTTQGDTKHRTHKSQTLTSLATDVSDDGFRPLTIFIILRLVPNGRALRAPEPSCYKGMNVNVIVSGVIVQNFPPVSGNQSQPGENNYKPTMDIAVCLIDSCQDYHLTLKTKHSSS